MPPTGIKYCGGLCGLAGVSSHNKVSYGQLLADFAALAY